MNNSGEQSLGVFHEETIEDDSFVQSSELVTPIPDTLSTISKDQFLEWDSEIRVKGALLGSLYSGIFGTPTAVYYPAAGIDTRLQYAFPFSNITEVEPNGLNVALMREYAPRNVRVLHGAAEGHQPSKKYDVVFSQRSHAPFLAEVKDLKDKGRLISEQRGVDEVFAMSNFKLVGVILLDTEDDRGPRIVTENLAGYAEIDERFADEVERRKPRFSNMRKMKADYYIFEKKDDRPVWMQKWEKGTGALKHGNSWYTYTILDRTMDPRLQGFLGFQDKKHLFISDEVDPRFKEYWLRHELIEFQALDKRELGDNVCVEALKKELELVPEDIRAEYIPARRDFFDRIVAFYETHYPESALILSLKRSRDYLTHLPG